MLVSIIVIFNFFSISIEKSSHYAIFMQTVAKKLIKHWFIDIHAN